MAVTLLHCIETRYKEEIDRDAVHRLLEIIIRHGLGHLMGVHNLHRRVRENHYLVLPSVDY